MSCVQCYPALLETLEQLREFWDPDTVELMTWIRYGQVAVFVVAAVMVYCHSC